MSSTQSLPKNANCLYDSLWTLWHSLPAAFALPCHAYDTHATGSMVHLRHIFAKDWVEMDFFGLPSKEVKNQKKYPTFGKEHHIQPCLVEKLCLNIPEGQVDSILPSESHDVQLTCHPTPRQMCHGQQYPNMGNVHASVTSLY